MASFGDCRDIIAKLPFVTHGHATQGENKREGPGTYGYALYPARAQLARFAYQHEHAGEPGCTFRIFEYGCLLGYSLLGVAGDLRDNARFDAALEIGWCDDESTEPGSNSKAIENAATVGFDRPFVCYNRVEAPEFGRASMVMVDGSHDHENTMLDIGMAMLLQPCVITLDDVIPTHAGVEDALRLCAPLFASAFRVPTVNGLGVLSTIPGLQAKMKRNGWVVQGMDEAWS